jgi:hypothetical protein
MTGKFSILTATGLWTGDQLLTDELSIFYWLKIFAIGIGHKLWQHYLESAAYNLLYVIYITTTIQWNITIYIKMYTQTSQNGEKSNEKRMISEREKLIQKK